MRTPTCQALVLLVCMIYPSVRGESELKREMAALAKQIQSEAEKYGGAVILGEFTGPPELASTGGPGIVQILKQELETAGVAVTRKAQVAIKGEYRVAADSKTNKTALAILARLVDRTGKELLELQARGLFDLTTIASVTGVTMVAPVNTSVRKREEAVDQALATIQKPCIKGTRIAASDNSPYAIEILVGPDPGAGTPDLTKYRPRAASIDADNLAFLNIGRGEVYAVRVLNNSEFDAAMTLTIDGLNMFTFSDKKAYEFAIIPAGSQGIIPGWHRNNEISDAFQVSEYSKSAVAKQIRNSSSIGTIHVSFKAAWPRHKERPPDEFPSGSRDSSATARGAELTAKYAEVVRDVGKLREAVSVRYTKEGDPLDLPDSRPDK